MAIFDKLVPIAGSKKTTNRGEDKQQQKSVSFSHDFTVIHFELAYERPRDIWYTYDDEIVFGKEHKKMAELLEKRIDPNIIEFKMLREGDSPRGLEYAHPITLAKRNLRYENAIAAVIVSQRVCLELDIDNAEDAIAWEYSQECQSATTDALELASFDAQFVIDHVRKSVDVEKTYCPQIEEPTGLTSRRRRSFRPTTLLRRTKETRTLRVEGTHLCL